MKIRKTETALIKTLLSNICHKGHFQNDRIGLYDYVSCDFGTYGRKTYGMRAIDAAHKLVKMGVLTKMDSHSGYETIRNSFSHHWSSVRFVAGPNFALALGGQRRFK